MTKSNMHRNRQYWENLIYSEADLHPAGYEGNVRFDAYGNDAPPYKVGKQFPYTNPTLLESFVAPKPHPKSPLQLQAEMSYLGRDRHLLPKKKATHKHHGDGTMRRSSRRRPYRDMLFQRDGHSVVPIELIEE